MLPRINEALEVDGIVVITIGLKLPRVQINLNELTRLERNSLIKKGVNNKSAKLFPQYLLTQ